MLNISWNLKHLICSVGSWELRLPISIKSHRYPNNNFFSIHLFLVIILSFCSLLFIQIQFACFLCPAQMTDSYIDNNLSVWCVMAVIHFTISEIQLQLDVDMSMHILCIFNTFLLQYWCGKLRKSVHKQVSLNCLYFPFSPSGTSKLDLVS